MASSMSEIVKGTKRRSGLPVRVRSGSGSVTSIENSECRTRDEGIDSGLSSECTTPTGGSPPPRQAKASNISALIAASRAKLENDRISSNRTSRLLRSRSGTDSPRSLDSVKTRQIFSPLRPSRNVQSPGLDSGDEGSLRLERGTYQHMFQDIVSIKTMLLKLKRILQESGENSLMRAETLNPFDKSLKNGLFYNLDDEEATDVSTSPGYVKDSDELIDLRRQVIFLQGQVEDKDRTIQLLQLQIAKHEGQRCVDTHLKTSLSQSEVKETSNAATQTEKIRPASTGSTILQSLPQDGNVVGPLVSWSEFSNHHPPSIAEFDEGKFRKSTARSYRMLHSPKEDTANRKIGYPAVDYCLNKISSKDIPSLKTVDLGNTIKDCPMKIESSSIKSSIPPPRRLVIPTLITRTARATSVTGLLPSPNIRINLRGYNPGSSN